MMRKIYLALAMALVSVGAMFADNNMALGVEYNYATKGEEGGVGFQFQYDLTENIRLAPELNLLFKHDGNPAVTQFGVNVHYVVPVINLLDIYPLAGVGYAHVGDNFDRFSVNLGCGVDLNLTDQFGAFVEERYQIINDWSGALTSVGLKYKF